MYIKLKDYETIMCIQKFCRDENIEIYGASKLKELVNHENLGDLSLVQKENLNKLLDIVDKASEKE